MHLRRPALVHLAPSFRRMPVVRAPVGLQRTEQPLGRNARLQPPEATHRPFFLDEEGRIELAGRIIHRHNQIPLTTGHTFMRGAVLMEHHPGQRFARPFLAMRPTPGRPDHLPSRLQGPLRPRVGPRPTMLLLPTVVKMLDRPPV